VNVNSPFIYSMLFIINEKTHFYYHNEPKLIIAMDIRSLQPTSSMTFLQTISLRLFFWLTNVTPRMSDKSCLYATYIHVLDLSETFFNYNFSLLCFLQNRMKFFGIAMLSAYLRVCMSASALSLSPCLPVSVSARLRVCISPCPSASVSARLRPSCLRVCLSPCLRISVSACLHVSVSAYLRVCVFACLLVCVSCFPTFNQLTDFCETLYASRHYNVV
jgi:hypothetical protein